MNRRNAASSVNDQCGSTLPDGLNPGYGDHGGPNMQFAMRLARTSSGRSRHRKNLSSLVERFSESFQNWYGGAHACCRHRLKKIRHDFPGGFHRPFADFSPAFGDLDDLRATIPRVCCDPYKTARLKFLKCVGHRSFRHLKGGGEAGRSPLSTKPGEMVQDTKLSHGNSVRQDALQPVARQMLDDRDFREELEVQLYSFVWLCWQKRSPKFVLRDQVLLDATTRRVSRRRSGP